ncbi:MAG: Bug family tripartite tricarboxylate transporter substrate binding protein [Vulcanimicrobiaceae bacterium]
MKTKTVLASVFGIATAIGSPIIALAQSANYPTKPIRIIAPFPPGGSVDSVARLVANELAKPLGQQIVVDNRSGASGNIGMEVVKNAAPDGYTLVLNTLPFVTNQFLYSRVPYDAVTDFAPVSLISSSPSLLAVHPSLPARSVKELIALAKSRPGRLNYGSAGTATNPHIAGELFNYLAKTDIIAVHFKGGGPALIATMSGETEMTISNITETFPLVNAKRLRGLGVTGLKRAKVVPDIPTIAEAGLPGYEFITWHALAAPKSTPAPVIAVLSEKLRSTLRTPEETQKFADRGLDVIASTPEELSAHLKSEVQKWARVIKERGMRAE